MYSLYTYLRSLTRSIISQIVSSSHLIRTLRYLALRTRDSIVFITITGILLFGGSYVYAAWTSISSSYTQNGAPLSQYLMDAIRTNLDDLNTRVLSTDTQVSTLNTSISGINTNILTLSGKISTLSSTPSTNPWAKTGDNIYYTGGNVGIGTTNPRVSLDINGEIVTNTRLTLAQHPDTTSPTWHINNDSDRFRIFRQPNISTAGQAFVHINNQGYVGIGVDNPQVKLDIMGTAGNLTTLKVNGKDGGVADGWPAGWGGGIQTWDILAMSLKLNGGILFSDGTLQNTSAAKPYNILVTVNDVNNGGGTPCTDAYNTPAWTQSCASRACKERGYTTGFAIEWDTNSGLGGGVWLSCFK